MNVQTRIQAVTVYSDRARILRSGNFETQSGITSVRVTGLPGQIDEKSIRASLRGPARILSLETAHVRFNETPYQAVQELETKIERIQDQLTLIEHEIRIELEKASHANGILEQSKSMARGYATGTLSIEKNRELFAFVDETARSVARTTIEKSQEKRKLERELQKLQGDLNSLRGQQSREQIDCIIQIESSEGGKCELDLTYIRGGASWNPLYDIRFDKKLTIHYLAEIRHHGEDWNDVELTLSTAQASLSTTVPEFSPWFLQEARPVPPSYPSPAPAMMQARGAAMEAEESDESPEFLAATMAPSTVSAEGAAVTYKLAGRATIPGNNEPRKATIAVKDLSHNLDYVTAPKLADSVFRRAKFRNDSDLMLLAGECQLFFSDDYIGQSWIPQTAPQEDREIYLGVENRLRVTRDLKHHEVDKKFLGDNRTLRWKYSITVENLLPSLARILVREQIPVSAHQQIKVKVESSDPGQIKDQNKLEWELDLKSTQKTELLYELFIEHPIQLPVIGLP
ncbi:MAG: mucoidy inhibitor MuiA family protein [Spirochaetia bacterium]|nr:mucoidy inhibitor MuiA family protein [Spirochaetia bacterium]